MLPAITGKIVKKETVTEAERKEWYVLSYTMPKAKDDPSPEMELEVDPGLIGSVTVGSDKTIAIPNLVIGK
jgi:hypothetical protein